MELHELSGTHTSARKTLQRIAIHVLARRRVALCGKFGLRATPGGIGTPACGPDHEVIRIAANRLIRETSVPTARSTGFMLDRATLTDAARFVGVDVSEPLDVGKDTPPLGDPTGELVLELDATTLIHAWFDFGWSVLDAVSATLDGSALATVVQLWPEHFDAGFDAAAAPERRVNFGASPGDAFSDEPYLYVGPWDPARPGDPAYWNAPFGAVMRYDELRSTRDPVDAACGFMLRGLHHVASAPI
jgi:hypothetical protein